jgi:hypothetical protein
MALYNSNVSVARVRGAHRIAVLPTGITAAMGVHGPIAEHYKLESDNLPMPVDYIVAATAG